MEQVTAAELSYLVPGLHLAQANGAFPSFSVSRDHASVRAYAELVMGQQGDSGRLQRVPKKCQVQRDVQSPLEAGGDERRVAR